MQLQLAVGKAPEDSDSLSSTAGQRPGRVCLFEMNFVYLSIFKNLKEKFVPLPLLKALANLSDEVHRHLADTEI